MLSDSFYKASNHPDTNPKTLPYPQKTYRTIPLMNIDVKTFNKISANRTQKHIKSIIHHYYVGFNPVMQRRFNTYKSINMIYHVNKMRTKNQDHLNMQKKHLTGHLGGPVS